MQKLLDFLLRKKHWALFLLLEFISLTLLFQSNAYQGSIAFAQINTLVSKVSSMGASVTSYFNLKSVNENLNEENEALLSQIIQLQSQLNRINAEQAGNYAFVAESSPVQFDFISANVVGNTTTQLKNYIRINKGEKDGITPDMGVISERGVVGIVSNVQNYYAIVIPILNTKMSFSCKIKGSNNVGSLVWDGNDIRYAQLEQLPRHIEFAIGDTVVTTGYSTAFPADMMVGTVSASDNQRDDNFYSLTIKLSTDFNTLQNVRVIKNYTQDEQLMLEKEARKND